MRNIRNYERMRMMRGGGRQIGFERGRYASYPESRYPEYPESRYPDYREDNSGIEPGRAYPNGRMSMHYGGRSGRMSYQPPEEQGMPYEVAEEWVRSMTRSDGGRGAKWKFEDAERLMQEHKIDCNPVEFWVALNAVYSDYGKVCKMFGMTKDEFWVKMAEAFICDEDAVGDKLMAYYECVVDMG